jgi:hypothetical protein
LLAGQRADIRKIQILGEFVSLARMGFRRAELSRRRVDIGKQGRCRLLGPEPLLSPPVLGLPFEMNRM